MIDQDVLFRAEKGIVTITLNRVARHNALTSEMLRQIDHMLETIESDVSARVLVLRTNSDRFFSSGADIKEWGDIDSEGMGSRWIRLGNRVFRRLAELDIPTIAVLSAPALGGGLELALACDLRYAANSASVGFPEGAVGAIPGWQGCQRLLDLVGPARARELILQGNSIGAERAAAWGIVNAAVSAEELDGMVSSVCEVLKSRSRVSQSVAKRLLRIAESGDMAISHEFAASVCKSTEDALEGVKAFREKRKAIFE